MYQSEHDKVAERKRDEAYNRLIDHYMEVAIAGSDEYGFLNVAGHEVPDPTVIEPPLGYVPTPDLMEQMRRMVRTALSDIADQQDFETFDEADDFDIDEDPVDYSSPYEMYFDPAPDEPAGPAGDGTRQDPNAGGGGGSPPPVSPPGGAQPPAGSPAPGPTPSPEPQK